MDGDMETAEGRDDDYKAEADEAPYSEPEEPESEDEDKTFISNFNGFNSTVAEEKKRWYRPFERAALGNGIYPISMNFVFWGLLAWLCHYLANDKAAIANEYTQYHASMNEGFFYSICGSLLMIPGCMSLYSWGKFENKGIRAVVEPFLMLFRLAAAGAFLYYVVGYNLLYRWLGGSYFALYHNWWHHPKTDPWLTNASYFNAALSWPIWFFGWAVLGYCGAIGVMLVIIFLLHVVVNVAGMRMYFLKPVLIAPKLAWLYLRGLSFSQYDRPFNPEQKCPACNLGFGAEDKIGTLPCNETHWYHRACLGRLVNPVDPREVTCGHCQKSFEHPPKAEEEPAAGSEEAAAEEAAPVEEAATAGE